MPVPGSLKRQPVDSNEIGRLLQTQFNVPTLETLAYVQMVERNKMDVDEIAATLSLSATDARELLQSMRLRGLVIQAPSSKDAFSALHPRMTLTNIFKLYERELVQSLRDRRATVDRIVNLLTPLFEEKADYGD